MNHRVARVATVLLLVLSLSTSLVRAAGPYRLPRRPHAVVFAFDTGGAVNLAGHVEILADGHERMVTRAPCEALLNPRAIVPHRRLIHLLRLVRKVRFFALPARIPSGRKSVDVTGRTITVRTSSRSKTVWEGPSATNARFDRLYAALQRAAPFTSDSCPQSLTVQIQRIQAFHQVGAAWVPETSVQAGEPTRFEASYLVEEPAGLWPAPCVAGTLTLARNGEVVATLAVHCPAQQTGNGAPDVYADAGLTAPGTVTARFDLSYNEGQFGTAQGSATAIFAVTAPLPPPPPPLPRAAG